jgi:hypothetical protein
MSQAGYTPIYLYHSTVAAAVPSSANLGDGELALNLADKLLYTLDDGGNVFVLASGNVTYPSSGTLATLAGTETLTNKDIQPRVVSTASATSITINLSTTDIATMANTASVGTFTINAPTGGSPYNGQKLIFRMSSTSVQTFSWNAIFQGSTDLPLPTASSSGGKYDYMGFMYNSTAVKWQLIASNFGF